MKFSLFLASVALVSVAALEPTELAYATHVMLAKADSTADKLMQAMDNVAQAIAAADDKLNEAIAKGKSDMEKIKASAKKNMDDVKAKAETTKADVVTISHKAAEAMTGKGGFDWSKFVPGKMGGAPSSKLADSPETKPSAAAPSGGKLISCLLTSNLIIP